MKEKEEAIKNVPKEIHEFEQRQEMLGAMIKIGSALKYPKRMVE